MQSLLLFILLTSLSSSLFSAYDANHIAILELDNSANDSSGNGYNFTNSGVNFVTEPKPPQGSHSAGNNYAIGREFTSPAAFDAYMSGRTAWTIEGYVYYTGWGAFSSLLFSNYSGSTGVQMRLAPSAVLAGINGVDYTFSGTYLLNTWYYWAVSFDGTTTRCYVFPAFQMSTEPIISQNVNTAWTGAALLLGRGKSTSWELPLNGYLDRVVVSDVARTQFPSWQGTPSVYPTDLSGLLCWFDSESSTATGITLTAITNKATGGATTIAGTVLKVQDPACRNRNVLDFGLTATANSLATHASFGALGRGDSTWIWHGYPPTLTGNGGDTVMGLNTNGANCGSFSIGNTIIMGWDSCDTYGLTEFGTAGATTYQVFTTMIRGGKLYRWTDYSEIKTNGNAVNFNLVNGGVFVGNWLGRVWRGRLSEALVYNRALSEDERLGIVTYLKNGGSARPSAYKFVGKRIISGP